MKRFLGFPIFETIAAIVLAFIATLPVVAWLRLLFQP
jgi:hypothetical protein